MITTHGWAIKTPEEVWTVASVSGQGHPVEAVMHGPDQVHLLVIIGPDYML